MRERSAADPAYREKRRQWWREHRERLSARHRARRATPEYRERRNARYATNVDSRERRNARRRERFATDPEFRERRNARRNAQVRARYATDVDYRERQKARRRERLATDPEFRERRNARERERYARVSRDPGEALRRQRRRDRSREWHRNDPRNRDPRYCEKRREDCRVRFAARQATINLLRELGLVRGLDIIGPDEIDAPVAKRRYVKRSNETPEERRERKRQRSADRWMKRRVILEAVRRLDTPPLPREPDSVGKP